MLPMHTPVSPPQESLRPRCISLPFFPRRRAHLMQRLLPRLFPHFLPPNAPVTLEHTEFGALPMPRPCRSPSLALPVPYKKKHQGALELLFHSHLLLLSLSLSLVSPCFKFFAADHRATRPPLASLLKPLQRLRLCRWLRKPAAYAVHASSASELHWSVAAAFNRHHRLQPSPSLFCSSSPATSIEPCRQNRARSPRLASPLSGSWCLPRQSP